MYIFGYICLLISLLCSLGAGLLALLQLRSREFCHTSLVRNAQYAISAAFILAGAALLHGLYWQDYSLEYVASYTDAVLPLFYRLTAFWAGQPGSMLFWAIATALCGSIFSLTRASKKLTPETRLWFWALFYCITAFFGLVLTGWSNPFIMLDPAPSDGQGLNPLLQNPGMIFHPPLLFLGYAGFTIPGCLALAQLLAPYGGEPRWPAATHAFYLLAWLLLTAGIVLGAWWAYMELGWGGYWAWDPVENASLLPWLFATAALHLLAIDRHAASVGRAASSLMAITVVSTFFATYLTRSGIIQSVHAFGDGGVGTPLLVFCVASLLVCLYIACLTGKVDGHDLAQPFSREGALVLTAWLLLALGLIIGFATLWPVISKLWLTTPQGLDAAFYNSVCLPLGVILLVLLCVCFWAGWTTPLNDPIRFCATLGIFLASGLVIWHAGYRQPLALICAAGAIAAICAMLLALTKVRVWRNTRRLGAVGAHLGFAVLALGVAFSGPYKTERDLLFAKGQTEQIGSYSVSLEGIQDGAGPGYVYLRASLNIREGSEELGQLAPERRIYAKFGDMQFSEVDVLSGFGRDIYASLLGMDEDYRVLVRISLEPLVNWIWIGGLLMCILPLAGLLRRRARQ